MQIVNEAEVALSQEKSRHASVHPEYFSLARHSNEAHEAPHRVHCTISDLEAALQTDQDSQSPMEMKIERQHQAFETDIAEFRAEERSQHRCVE